MIEARHAHLTACAIQGNFSEPPPGISEQLHELVIYFKLDLVEFYSLPLPDNTLDRWFLWLLEVERKDYPTSAPVAALYRRRLNGDEPSKEEWDEEAAASAAGASAAASAASWTSASSAAAASLGRMRAALISYAKGATP